METGIAPQGTNIVFFDDIAATIQAMLSGQVDAAGMSAFAAKSVADCTAVRTTNGTVWIVDSVLLPQFK